MKGGFDVTGYLKDLDQEAAVLRQEIRMRQVRLQEIADTRVLMMRREEERAAANGHASPFGALNGMELAVRDPIAYAPYHVAALAPPEPPDPAPKRRAAAKRDHNAEYRRRKQAQRARIMAEYGVGNEEKRRPRSDAGVPNAARGNRGHTKKHVYMARIRELMADGQPRSASDIMEVVRPADRVEKQSVYNALSYMKLSTGELTHDEMGGRYVKRSLPT